MLRISAFAAALFVAASALAQSAPLDVENMEIQAERDAPQVCFDLTERLARDGVDYRQYLRVEPAVDMAASVRDDQLCVEGLRHGESYVATLRAGLPAASGAKLAGDRAFEVAMPERAPMLAFRGDGYVLPRVGSEGLPLRSVNVDAATLSVYRVNDRALIEQLRDGMVGAGLDQWSAERLGEATGELVWSGEMAIDAPANAMATTAFPVEAALGELKPGVYVAAAENAAGPEREPWEARATQWFVVSDLGLTSYQGEDGLLVYARSFASAQPVKGATVSLLARDNRILGEATTGADGAVRFAPGLLRGKGGAAPQALFAESDGGDFVFLDLARPGFDLSDRGVGGRPAPGPLDAYLYAERGVYRPGETVHLTALLRDDSAEAVAGLPLTLKLLRPDGKEDRVLTLADRGAGGYGAELPLSDSAYTGQWTATAHADPRGAEIGRVEFLVEDFVPPRLEIDLTADAPALAPDSAVTVAIEGRFLYGAPAAGLTGEAVLHLQPAADPFPSWPGYRFGLVQDGYLPERIDLGGFETDADGRAQAIVAADAAPDASMPLEAELSVALFDVGGRPVNESLTIPFHLQPFHIGLKPRFADEQVTEGGVAGFDVIALAPDGTPTARTLSWTLYREDVEYLWFERDGQWDWRETIYDEAVAGGRVEVGAQPAAIEETVADWGRYRLEVFDDAAGAASSVRFYAGWRGATSDGGAPDKVSVTLDKDAYQAGDVAKIFVKPPFDADVQIVIADNEVRRSFAQRVGRDGATIEIPVSDDWTAGVYVMAAAYAPAAPGRSALPGRAVGLAWLALDPAPKSLEVALDLPQDMRPRQTLTVPVRVTGGEGPVYVTVAAVDDGVLQLTDHQAPDPVERFLGKRRLGVEMRDLYGRLIDPSGARAGQIRSGGDGVERRQLKGLPQRSSRVVALHSGILETGPDGRAQASFDVPDFNGRLRVMAVAWTAAKVGHAEGTVVARDPLIAELALPRFLAPDDRAELTLSLQNLSAPEGDYVVWLRAEGAVAFADDGAQRFRSLKKGGRGQETVTLVGREPGVGRIRMSIDGPESFQLTREFALSVRPANPVTTDNLVAMLDPGESMTVNAAVATGYHLPTAELSYSVSGLPDFDAAGLLASLSRYPYGCAEQTTSKALPLLYANDVAAATGLAQDSERSRHVEGAIRRLVDYQRSDGGFGFWGPRGSGDDWLNAYVMDFLTRAREQGHDVPDAAYELGLSALRGAVRYSPYDDWRLSSQAYAHYVLARAGAEDASQVRYFYETYWPRLPSDMARAHVGAALALLGDRQRAEAAFDFVLGEEARLHLANWHDYGTATRDRAAVLALMAESGVADDRRLYELATELQNGVARLGKQWLSTQERAWLLLAAHALQDRHGPLAVRIDGQPATDGGAVYRALPNAADAQARVVNDGDRPVYVTTSVTGVRLEPPGPEANGFGLNAELMTLGGRPANFAELRQNEVYAVVIDGEAPDASDIQRRALLVDMLPAGLEIENVRLGAGARPSDMAWLGELDEPTHVEFRDDRYVAALDLGWGKRAFRLVYLVRAVTPGDYVWPGTHVEDMYQPDLFARADWARIQVKPAR